MTLGFDSVLVEVARSAIALLIAALAIYLSLRLLGKIAKFFIGAILVGLVLYFIFTYSDIIWDSAEVFLRLPALGGFF